jgi:aldehyde dehydrogenase (NAD+)
MEDKNILQYTPIDTIEPTIQRLRKSFRNHVTKKREWRVEQLLALKKGLTAHESEIIKAVQKDLNMDLFLASNEAIGCNDIIDDAIANLSEWMSPKSELPSIINLPGSTKKYKDPLGVILLIAPWNFPVSLITRVLVGIIAAGNCCVIKPSEISENTSAIVGRVLTRYLDPNCFAVVQGAKDETTALLEHKFDLIQYTGGGSVGRLIMAAASKYLTPTILELGGKCPVLVDKDTNLDVAIPRIIWGKFINAGQVCIAPDYILVHESREKEFIEKAKLQIEKFYTKQPKESADFGRIINTRHAQRVSDLMTGGKVICGGDVDVENRYVSPTLLTNVDLNSKLMKDEIFGPLLPIIPIKDMQKAIDFVNERDKPLSLYVFTNDYAFAEEVFSLTSSGGGCVNECIMHNTCQNLKFGGVGESGMGGYNGKYSFDAFSHEKGVLIKGERPDIALRFPPFTPEKVGTLRSIVGYVKLIPSSSSLFKFVSGLAMVVAVTSMYYYNYNPLGIFGFGARK